MRHDARGIERAGRGRWDLDWGKEEEEEVVSGDRVGADWGPRSRKRTDVQRGVSSRRGRSEVSGKGSC